MLLSTARQDAKDKGIDVRGLSVTKSSLGGYEVQGRFGFYRYSSSACCSYCAKAEAIDALIEADDEVSEIIAENAGFL